MSLADTACVPGQVRQVGHHKTIHERLQTDHMAPRTPHEEMSSGPRASGVKVPSFCTSWACAYSQNARALNKHGQTSKWYSDQTFMCHKYHVKHTSKQRNLDRLKSGLKRENQRDANLCGACARSTDERSLVRGGGGYNQGSFVYLAKACGGWMFADVNGVVCANVK